MNKGDPCAIQRRAVGPQEMVDFVVLVIEDGKAKDANIVWIFPVRCFTCASFKLNNIM